MNDLLKVAGVATVAYVAYRLLSGGRISGLGEPMDVSRQNDDGGRLVARKMTYTKRVQAPNRPVAPSQAKISVADAVQVIQKNAMTKAQYDAAISMAMAEQQLRSSAASPDPAGEMALSMQRNPSRASAYKGPEMSRMAVQQAWWTAPMGMLLTKAIEMAVSKAIEKVVSNSDKVQDMIEDAIRKESKYAYDYLSLSDLRDLKAAITPLIAKAASSVAANYIQKFRDSRVSMVAVSVALATDYSSGAIEKYVREKVREEAKPIVIKAVIKAALRRGARQMDRVLEDREIQVPFSLNGLTDQAKINGLCVRR